jgi:hypothetical protein
MVEVTFIGRSIDNRRHGRNIKPEERAANDGHRRNYVDIPHDKHSEFDPRGGKGKGKKKVDQESWERKGEGWLNRWKILQLRCP